MKVLQPVRHKILMEPAGPKFLAARYTDVHIIFDLFQDGHLLMWSRSHELHNHLSNRSKLINCSCHKIGWRSNLKFLGKLLYCSLLMRMKIYDCAGRFFEFEEEINKGLQICSYCCPLQVKHVCEVDLHDTQCMCRLDNKRTNTRLSLLYLPPRVVRGIDFRSSLRARTGQPA